MNKFQAVFEILYILCCVDGEVDESETEVIVKFIKQNADSIYFTPSEVIDSLYTLTEEGVMEELSNAVHSFKNSSTATERTALMTFAVELVLADGYITKEEKDLLHIIANTLNLDLNRLLDQYA
ncbi:MAG: TerB family tellurite resistance protein [Microcystis sp. M113S1]|jgi:tellurite resistance protein|uniref:tellurite resistance TerB family protein n=1 Tax=Microcystis sp. M113S1 TaxID=2771104 RepID=UPI002588E67E|nr:TerB family tellurite resistance protein [Microcystis sp. M113S1]MCA2939992.1 TerB family tellurite resistance protein [Microcystis sp. M113S1]